jgi:hypothetical protein
VVFKGKLFKLTIAQFLHLISRMVMLLILVRFLGKLIYLVHIKGLVLAPKTLVVIIFAI